jgi:Phosphotransferase enzyme family.
MLGNEYAVLEHYESGTPMDRIFSGWHINDALPRRIAGQVTDLLVLLANITAGEGCRKPDFRARVMEVAQLAVAKPEFSETERDRLIRMVDEGLAAEPEVVFRYVLQHRDFRPENMVYSLRPRSMVVFDWEYARQDGVPLVDLFYFLFRCAAWHKQKPVRLKKFFPAGDIFQRGMDVNILDHVFYKRNSCSQIAAEQVSRYCRQVGVTRNCAQLLFLQFVAKHLDFNPEFLKRFLNDSQPLFLRGLCEKR